MNRTFLLCSIVVIFVLVPETLTARSAFADSQRILVHRGRITSFVLLVIVRACITSNRRYFLKGNTSSCLLAFIQRRQKKLTMRMAKVEGFSLTFYSRS